MNIDELIKRYVDIDGLIREIMKVSDVINLNASENYVDIGGYQMHKQLIFINYITDTLNTLLGMECLLSSIKKKESD